MIDGRLDVLEKSGGLTLILHLKNLYAHAVYLPRELAEDDELFGPYGDIRISSGKVVPYIGPKVKRAASDLLALGPHGQLCHAIDISRAYAFLLVGTPTFCRSRTAWA